MKLHKYTALALVLLYFLPSIAQCFEFDKNNVAVYFAPYVKRGSSGPGENSIHYSYTFENIKTMMEVVAGRFSKVFTSGSGTFDNNYVQRFTYYNVCWPVVNSAEAAALINKERGQNVLTVTVGISQTTLSMSFETEIALALESVDIANKVSPGTAEAVWLQWATFSEDSARNILKYLIGLNRAASLLGIKVGSTLNCNSVRDNRNDTLFHLQIEILNKVNFVVCDVYMASIINERGPEESFRSTADSCSRHQRALRMHKANANVMCTATWTTAEEDDWQTAENQSVYWKKANEWAVNTKTMMIMRDAFDRERNGLTEESHQGWWRLTDNSKVETPDGYLEKSTGLTGIANKNQSGGEYLKLNRTVFPRDETEPSRFAVRFSPYVKFGVNDKPNGYYTYTQDNVNTMMQVVSGKFSRIFTTGVGSNNDVYFPNVTYYNSFAIAYAAEAAARINQITMNKNLTVVVGINKGLLSNNLETEVAVAIESVQKANNIFLGTVDGIYFRWPLESEDDSLQVLEQLKVVRIPATLLNLKIGVLINCQVFVDSENTTLYQIQQEMVNVSDFVICPLIPHNSVAELGPELSFRSIFQDFLSQRVAVQKVNCQVEVFMETMWSSSGELQWETIENLEIYWNTAKSWADNHNFTVIMAEAIDNEVPDMSNASTLGWWRLTDNSKINSVDGYLEKILGEIPDKTDKTESSTGLISSTTDAATSTTHGITNQPDNGNGQSYVQISLQGLVALIIGNVIGIGGLITGAVVLVLSKRQNNRNLISVDGSETDIYSLTEFTVSNGINSVKNDTVTLSVVTDL